MRVSFVLPALLLMGSTQVLADPPVADLPPGPARRVERREERREVRQETGRAIAPQGATINAPGVNVTVPPAGTGQLPTVTTPGAVVDPNRVAPAVTVDGTRPAVDPDRWRFKWHNGQWWYWMANNSWVIWDGQRWMPYEANRYTTGYRGVDDGAGYDNSGTYINDGGTSYYRGRPYYGRRLGRRGGVYYDDGANARPAPGGRRPGDARVRFNRDPVVAPMPGGRAPAGQAPDIGARNPTDGLRGGAGRTEVPDRGEVKAPNPTDPNNNYPPGNPPGQPSTAPPVTTDPNAGGTRPDATNP